MKLSEVAEILHSSYEGGDVEFESISTDTRTLTSGQLFIALSGPNFNANDFVKEAENKGAAGAIVSQSLSVSMPTIKVDDTRVALAHLARHHREKMNIPVIGVTGSCGKTTTRALMASIFGQAGNTLASEGSFNNDIGVPLTLLRLTTKHDYAVVEMGANHPGEIAYLTNLVHPDVAIITNAGAAHLEGFGDLDGVACAKGEIFQGLPADGVGIINNDDCYADFWRNLVGSKRLVTFAVEHPADVMAIDISMNEQSLPCFHLRLPEGDIEINLPLMGEHNVMNALAAAAAAYALEVPIESIKRGLETVVAVKRRLNEYKGYNGATIIDDSYNANPSSVAAAIDVLAKRPGDAVLVFGDMLELGEDANKLHSEIGDKALRSGITRLYCYGDHARYAAKAFGEQGYHFDDQESLLRALRSFLNKNTTVLVKGSLGMKMSNITAALLEE